MVDNSLENLSPHELVEELSHRMQLNEDEADKFRHAVLTRCGYTRKQDWTPPEGDKGDKPRPSPEHGERRRGGWFPPDAQSNGMF